MQRLPAMPVKDFPRLAAAPPPATTRLIDARTIQQTVLKLAQSGLADTSAISPAIAAQLVEPWQQLVMVIEELRSPASGWSPELPQTPENLAPYVLEEANDVLEILQAPPANKAGERALLFPLRQDYFLLETLSPWLLWCVASSAYEVMQLMEGITARVFQADQGWQTGVLRLTTLLEIKMADHTQQFDLATYQAPEFLLAPHTSLQSDDCELCQHPTNSEDLLQQFTQQLQTTEVQDFLQGVETEILVPGNVWQSGSLHLRLGFEFITATEDDVVDWVLNTDSLAPPTEVAVMTADSSSSTVLKPTLQFTDDDWLKAYTAAIAQQQLCQLLPQLSGVFALQGKVTASDAVPKLVAQVCDTIEQLPGCIARSSRNFLQQEIELDDLRRRLLWCWSSNSYEVMQLIGGVTVNLLQPQAGWITGTLRLQISLKIKTPELDWHLDLATSQTPSSQPFVLATNAVVRSAHSTWCQQPILVEQLSDRIEQKLDKVTPELQLLLEGTSIDLLAGDRAWQPGAIQLNRRLEFIPLYSSLAAHS